MKKISCVALAVLLALLSGGVAVAAPGPVFSPAGFTAPMQVIDYSNSPVGLLPGSSSITNQYASLGVLHDGSTTTPPGPGGISSLSGLPGLESSTGDPDPDLPVSIQFTVPVNQVGAYFLMGWQGDSFTLEAFRANNSVIQTVTIAPVDMLLRPGPFGYNEGFIGLIAGEPIASVRFSPSTLPFVIDDLHFGVPEPTSIALCGLLAVTMLVAWRRPIAPRSD